MRIADIVMMEVENNAAPRLILEELKHERARSEMNATKPRARIISQSTEFRTRAVEDFAGRHTGNVA